MYCIYFVYRVFVQLTICTILSIDHIQNYFCTSNAWIVTLVNKTHVFLLKYSILSTAGIQWICFSVFLHISKYEEKNSKVIISGNQLVKKHFISEQIWNPTMHSTAFCVRLCGILQNPEDQTVWWERALRGRIVKSDSLIWLTVFPYNARHLRGQFLRHIFDMYCLSGILFIEPQVDSKYT